MEACDSHHCDERWAAIRAALAKETLRTVEGISSETKIPEPEVQRLLDEHPNEVRKAYVTDRGGRTQYTLSERPIRGAELWATIRAFATSTP